MMETAQLYPLNIGEILDRVFSLYRRNVGLLLGIALVGYAPITILQVVSYLIIGDSQYLYNFQIIFIYPLVSGALIVATSQIYLRQPTTIRNSYQAISRRYRSLLGGSLLFACLVSIPSFVIILPLFNFLIRRGMNPDSIEYYQLLLLFTLVSVATFIGTRWDLNLICIVLEELKVVNGLYRSWDLTKGYFWRVFRTVGLLSLLAFIVSSLPRITFKFFFPDIAFSTLIQTILFQVYYIFATPLIEGINVVLYYDLLGRKEGSALKIRLNHRHKKETL